MKLNLFWQIEISGLNRMEKLCHKCFTKKHFNNWGHFYKILIFFSGRVPPFNEYLNVNTPLQIGGLMAQQFDPLKYRWSHTPMGKPFEGCIKNIIHNSKLYDLAEPGLQLASKPGCLQLEDVCKTSFPGKKFR